MRNTILFFGFCIFLSSPAFLYAQEKQKDQKTAGEQASVRSLVESRRYMFVPQTAMPQSGRARPLTTPYDLRVIGDSLNADLPYFGRAYVSPGYGGTDNALNFKTTQIEYVKKDRKDGGWDITITPKGVQNVSKINMRISDTGFTYITVGSNTRQPISFNGYIKALE